MSASSSRSSRWSASIGRGGSGGGGSAYDGQGSPVPYRVGPLAYEPEVKCWCNLKACQWISWSFLNPGCRYLKCQKARTGQGCGFFHWVDEGYSNFLKELLRDMRDCIWDLRKDVARKDAQLFGKDDELRVMQNKLEYQMQLVEAKDLSM